MDCRRLYTCFKADTPWQTKTAGLLSVIAAILSPKPSVQRNWNVALLCRRASVKHLNKDFRGALADLEEARITIRRHDDIDLEAVEKSIACLKKEMV